MIKTPTDSAIESPALHVVQSICFMAKLTVRCKNLSAMKLSAEKSRIWSVVEAPAFSSFQISVSSVSSLTRK